MTKHRFCTVLAAGCLSTEVPWPGSSSELKTVCLQGRRNQSALGSLLYKFTSSIHKHSTSRLHLQSFFSPLSIRVSKYKYLEGGIDYHSKTLARDQKH